MQLDLFSSRPAPEQPPVPEPRIWSVLELTRAVRSILEAAIGEVWVQGEICNFRRQASGHCYFGLKDERAVLSCVLFASAVPPRLELADGMLVQARGRVTVYEARGQYQLNVNLIEPAGAGLLQARFEALKRKLQDEGLFDPERKRPIPADPAVIGVVTSPTGAAVKDFLNIARRRAPWAQIIINPVRVQGAGSAAEIANAIQEFNDGSFDPAIDLLVVCRGGGSMEDLWAFNEEIVARAIAGSRIPVISAVGHEIDFTIADFAADLRAPTPSAAAELALPDRATLLRHLTQGQTRLLRAMESFVQIRRHHLASLAAALPFRFPERLVQDRAQRLDSAAVRLETWCSHGVRLRQERLAAAAALLRQHRPDQVFAMQKLRFEAQRSRLDTALRAALSQTASRLANATSLFRILSPEATLARGYSITLDADGRIIRSADAAKKGDRIRTRLTDGELESEVKKSSHKP